jgi:hypothetical protein
MRRHGDRLLDRDRPPTGADAEEPLELEVGDSARHHHQTARAYDGTGYALPPDADEGQDGTRETHVQPRRRRPLRLEQLERFASPPSPLTSLKAGPTPLASSRSMRSPSVPME